MRAREGAYTYCIPVKISLREHSITQITEHDGMHASSACCVRGFRPTVSVLIEHKVVRYTTAQHILRGDVNSRDRLDHYT